MAELFSKSMLKAFVDAYVGKSASLQFGAFTQKKIATEIFGRKDADTYLSRFFSPAPSSRPLTVGNLTAILNACRTLLHRQYCNHALSESDPDAKVTAFERDLCNQWAIGESGRVTVDDFRCDRRFESAITPVDFGIPDILEWNHGNFDFAAKIKATQLHAVDTLREVVPRIASLTDDVRRLQLLQVAVSAAALNHPGTRYHDEVTELAMTAAGSAQLRRLVNSSRTSDALRSTAIELSFFLNYNRLSPRIDSSTNYLRYALRGQPLPEKIWRSIRLPLEEAIIESDRFVEMDPTNSLANFHRSSILSMKARLMAVLENSGARLEAARMHRASLPFIERLPEPYGFIYPILKDIVASKIKSAIRRCEHAIVALERAGSPSASAFAALLVTLTHRLGGRSAVDSHFWQLALQARSSPGIQYKYSHIFDAAALRLALKQLRTVP